MTGIFLLILMGCAKGKFEKTSNPHCDSDTGACSYDETIYVSGGMVDVLFVDDNSGSMSFEQSKMGERFPTLLQKLDDRMLDYRIGITTTDISSPSNLARTINQNGALQDGQLISFGSGLKFLEPNTGNKNSLFLSAIQRPETLECENFISTSIAAGIKQSSSEYQNGYYEHCPSGDERGVMAAMNTVTKNPSSFIRPKAHLAVVIISDENERSKAISDSQNPYGLQLEDQPAHFIEQVGSKFPGKTLSVHSVVVKSSDTNCLQAQNAQMNGLVRGEYGTVYESLSHLTSGVIGSVCESDYGDQMGRIGAAIVERVEYFTVHCANPIDLVITFDPPDAGTGYHLEGRRVVFDRDLDPSSKVRFRYTCPVVE